MIDAAHKTFHLDPRLAASCFHLVDWPLSRVLLKNNQDYPWLILVPRRSEIREITDLTAADRALLMDEVHRLSTIMLACFQPDKLNLGTLGNVVSQFHFHVVARFKCDLLWPEGIWQAATIDKPYVDPDALIVRLRDKLCYNSDFQSHCEP